MFQTICNTLRESEREGDIELERAFFFTCFNFALTKSKDLHKKKQWGPLWIHYLVIYLFRYVLVNFARILTKVWANLRQYLFTTESKFKTKDKFLKYTAKKES